MRKFDKLLNKRKNQRDMVFNKNKWYFNYYLSAVQNERQPRNTATIRPEAFRDMEQGRALREAAVAVGVFG